MYAGLGCSGAIFILHAVVIYGWDLAYHRMSLQWLGLMALANVFGTVAHALRVCFLLPFPSFSASFFLFWCREDMDRIGTECDLKSYMLMVKNPGTREMVRRQTRLLRK